jgi:signal transduction histidine kinase
MSDIQSERYVSTTSETSPASTGSLNQHAALLDHLRQCERQVAVSSIAGMIAHMVGTPLNVIVGRAGLIRRHPDATEPIVNDAICIQQKVEQLTVRVRTLIELLSPHLPTVECEAAEVMQEAIQLYRPIAHARDVELRFSQGPPFAMRVNRFPALVVVTSLLSLAISEVAPSSTVAVNTSCARDAADAMAKLHVIVEVPGRVYGDPRKFMRFDAEAESSATANAQQVLGMCSAIARNVGGQLDVGPCHHGSELRLRWPSTVSAHG